LLLYIPDIVPWWMHELKGNDVFWKTGIACTRM